MRSPRVDPRDLALASAGAAAQRTQDYGDRVGERDEAIREACTAGWSVGEITAVTGLSYLRVCEIRMEER